MLFFWCQGQADARGRESMYDCSTEPSIPLKLFSRYLGVHVYLNPLYFNAILTMSECLYRILCTSVLFSRCQGVHLWMLFSRYQGIHLWTNKTNLWLFILNFRYFWHCFHDAWVSLYDCFARMVHPYFVCQGVHSEPKFSVLWCCFPDVRCYCIIFKIFLPREA